MTRDAQARPMQDALRPVLVAMGAMLILYILWRAFPT